jgi:hypothetical protein
MTAKGLSRSVELARHSAIELILTSILLFGVTTIVRFVVGPSAISRAFPQIHVALLIVGLGAPGTLGNTSLYSFNGPGVFQLDLALSRSFIIREKTTLQFRAEAFNLPNHLNPAVPVVSRGQNATRLFAALIATVATSQGPASLNWGKVTVACHAPLKGVPLASVGSPTRKSMGCV